MLDTKIKYFNELSLNELHDLLELRSEVFVVEQKCIYQDVDGKDKKALHVLGYDDSKLVAYTRIFKPGDYFEEVGIGRVTVKKNYRKHKYGYAIMKASFEAVESYFKTTSIKLSAQVYLKKFYNNLGFIEVGEAYLEDDIPHIIMIKT